MEAVGVRELKARASEIIAAVHERGERFQITKRGTPVALLLQPVGEGLRQQRVVRAGGDGLHKVGFLIHGVTSHHSV